MFRYLIIALCATSTVVKAIQPMATIAIGTIRGTTTMLPEATAPVNKFLGVPFASPPTRFMPPQPAVPLNFTLNTTVWRPACLQNFPGPEVVAAIPKAIFNQPPPKEDEDCLYMNIYTPSIPPPEGGFPVMFWLYGGGYESGTSSLPYYDGSAFAAYQDVIIVAPNYRTNLFGFPNSPELPDGQQNIGLLDQHMALRWVQDNIASFNGNKDRVTIFGQSAGAWSVDSMLLAYGSSKAAPFQAAILQSGQTVFKATNQTADRAVSWDKLVRALDCANAPSPLQCVQQAPAWLVQRKQALGFLSFVPVEDNKTWYSAKVIAQKRVSGDFAQVPVLEGTLSEEGRALTLGLGDLRTYLQNHVLRTTPQLVDTVVGLYNRTYAGNVYKQSAAVLTQVVFQCPQALHLKQTADHGIPAWGYYYNASYPNTAFSDSSGVWHSSEINVIFEAFTDGPVNKRPLFNWGLLRTSKPSTANQRGLGKEMNKLWADFAKDPRAGPGWDAFDGSAQGNIKVFQEAPSPKTHMTYGELTEMCELFKPVVCSYSPGASVC